MSVAKRQPNPGPADQSGQAEPSQNGGAPRIGQTLFEQGIVTQEQLREALARQAAQGGRLGEILFDLAGGDGERICQAIARALGVPWSRPDTADIPAEALEKIPARLATHYSIVPIALEDGGVRVAIAMPQDIELLDELELLIRQPILPALAMPKHIAEGIKKHYGVGADTIEQMRSLDGGALELDEIDQHTLDGGDDSDASIIRFVNQVVFEAHNLSATDIHFEPGQESFRIRYRIDGLLEEIPVPPQLKQYQSSITSRIKVMAKLNIAEQRLPQDGRIQVKAAGEIFDMRVSVLPTPLGESIDLRLLKRSNIRLSLQELGYAPDNLSLLEDAARRPNGIILITGPTGSGKTTSLYGLLDKINTVDRKIITIEDPIEYHLPGMIQMQVHEEIGFTFSRALRSVLRHDPDIVLVGEIRDPETAEIAIRMAMTGHLVLSTLHTNDAASTIARLIDMGQEPYLLATTILCVVAQRLVRILCPRCKTPYQPDEAMLAPFKAIGAQMPEQFHHAAGCEACRHSGHTGRTGIHEIFPIDEDFRQLIMDRAPASKFRALAGEKGIKIMAQDGFDRVRRGETALEEILRVTQAIEA